MTMADISNFGAILRGALQDPQTATAMRTVFKPLLEEQTREIKEEIASIKKDHDIHKKRTDSLEVKVSRLEQENNTLKEALGSQQRFLESVDFDRRRHNLIITGLSETSDLLHTESGVALSTDQDKIEHILGVIGQADIEVNKIQRLGDQSTNHRSWPRPIKVVLTNDTDRKKILQAAKHLKTTNDQLAKVYLKRDTHPGIRKEMNRLRDVEKKEKAKAENQGRNVRYDPKQRCVMVDDVVIDTYQPSFFKETG
jgi:hypothetical protein